MSLLLLNYGERVKLGDYVERKPLTFGQMQHSCERVYVSHTGAKLRGKVVYIHPLGRYHTVEFSFRDNYSGKLNKVRESFWGCWVNQPTLRGGSK